MTRSTPLLVAAAIALVHMCLSAMAAFVSRGPPLIEVLAYFFAAPTCVAVLRKTHLRSDFALAPMLGPTVAGARRTLGVLVAAGCVLRASAAPSDHNPSELIGTWRGTSTCADRVAAPACRDEVVVYDFTVGAKPGTAHWKADKVVEGQRELMGELDLVYDAGDTCWAAEFRSPRVRLGWCLVVDGAHLTGTGRLLPGKQTVRRIDARKD